MTNSATDAHRNAHGERAHAGVATYLTIAVVLTIVTAFEVAVIYVRRFAPVVVPLLLVMSAAKFSLVALFFMHLRYEPRPLAVMFFGPLVIALCLAIALMTLPGQFLTFGR